MVAKKESDFYKRGMNRRGLLTAEQEIELALKIRSGDKEARNIFIESNLKLVVMVAHKYARGNEELEKDLVQEGNIGLMTAVDKFDPDRGCRFSTHAMWWIRQSITRYLNNRGVIRIPVHHRQLMNKIMKIVYILDDDLVVERIPFSYIASEINKSSDRHYSVGKIEKMFKEYGDLMPVSLYSESGNSGEFVLIDSISNPDSDDPEKMVGALVDRDVIQKALSRLKEQQRLVMIKRFGLDGKPPETLEDISKALGVTKERIRQVQQVATRRLRNMLAQDYGGTDSNQPHVEIKNGTAVFSGAR